MGVSKSTKKNKKGILAKKKPEIININLTLDKAIYVRTVKMRKAKGILSDQELLRLFTAEGLERAGF